MNWISGLAIYFILWWVMLFAMLPIGLRTQDDEDEVVPGTVSSAPARPHMVRTIVRTTVAATIVFALILLLTEVLGIGFGDLPRIMPEFG